MPKDNNNDPQPRPRRSTPLSRHSLVVPPPHAAPTFPPPSPPPPPPSPPTCPTPPELLQQLAAAFQCFHDDIARLIQERDAARTRARECAHENAALRRGNAWYQTQLHEAFLDRWKLQEECSSLRNENERLRGGRRSLSFPESNVRSSSPNAGETLTDLSPLDALTQLPSPPTSHPSDRHTVKNNGSLTSSPEPLLPSCLSNTTRKRGRESETRISHKRRRSSPFSSGPYSPSPSSSRPSRTPYAKDTPLASSPELLPRSAMSNAPMRKRTTTKSTQQFLSSRPQTASPSPSPHPSLSPPRILDRDGPLTASPEPLSPRSSLLSSDERGREYYTVQTSSERKRQHGSTSSEGSYSPSSSSSWSPTSSLFYTPLSSPRACELRDARRDYDADEAGGNHANNEGYDENTDGFIIVELDDAELSERSSDDGLYGRP